MVAARGQDVLAGLPCIWCGYPLPKHAANCSLLRKEMIMTDEKIVDIPTGGPTKARFPLSAVRQALSDMGIYILEDDLLKRYCDNARAYGWEAGAMHIDDARELPAQFNTTSSNPFTDPGWDAYIKAEMNNGGFIVTARENQL